MRVIVYKFRVLSGRRSDCGLFAKFLVKFSTLFVHFGRFSG